MPISGVAPPPQPPDWWALLTANQRLVVLARLRKMGLNVTAWPR
jgi:hypothetical protein